MGYCVWTSGRLELSEAEERRLVPLLKEQMLEVSGWMEPDAQVATLDDLGEFAGTRCRREGGWLVLGEDDRADPKWSEQANAFWRGVGAVVAAGHAVVDGEDGHTWRYDFTPGGVVQTGRNGWDGARDLDGAGRGEDWLDDEWNGDVEGVPDRPHAPRPRAAASRQPVLAPTPGRIRLYAVCGVLPAVWGAGMLAAGNGTGLLPLALGGLNLAVAARLRRDARA